jgi:hypothetical protein
VTTRGRAHGGHIFELLRSTARAFHGLATGAPTLACRARVVTDTRIAELARSAASRAGLDAVERAFTPPLTRTRCPTRHRPCDLRNSRTPCATAVSQPRTLWRDYVARHCLSARCTPITRPKCCFAWSRVISFFVMSRSAQRGPWMADAARNKPSGFRAADSDSRRRRDSLQARYRLVLSRLETVTSVRAIRHYNVKVWGRAITRDQMLHDACTRWPANSRPTMAARP